MREEKIIKYPMRLTREEFLLVMQLLAESARKVRPTIQKPLSSDILEKYETWL